MRPNAASAGVFVLEVPVTRHEQLGTVRWNVSDASPIIRLGPLPASATGLEAESVLDASAILGAAPSPTDASPRGLTAASEGAPPSTATTQLADSHMPGVPLHAVPSGNVVHEPSFVAPWAIVHAVQLPRHGRSQHTPSERFPLEHALADVAGCPLASPHAPDPLHVEPDLQSECGSVPASEGPHIPAVPVETWSAAEQLSQTPHEELPQHTLSTHDVVPAHSWQFAVKQSPLVPAVTLHAVPCDRCGWQLPVPPEPVPQ